MNDRIGGLSPEDPVDVAIVGAGVAGAYAAYRLLADGHESSLLCKEPLSQKKRVVPEIQVFEISNRIGGRLWSYKFPGCEDLVAEIGGQAFTVLQRNVYELCRSELKLEMRPCLGFNSNQLQYFRRRAFHFSEYEKWKRAGSWNNNRYGTTIPFCVDEDERLEPAKLLFQTACKMICDLEAPCRTIIDLLIELRDDVDESGNVPAPLLREISSLTRVLRYAKVGPCQQRHIGSHTHDMGFWNWAATTLSNEAYRLLAYFVFADSSVRNYNLYDVLLAFLHVYFYFHLRTPFWSLRRGYDALPKTLIARFQDIGGHVHLRHRVYDVQLEEHSGERVIALKVGPSQTSIRSVVYARHVILAVPRNALSKLDERSILYSSEQLREDMNSVTAIPAAKLFLLFDQPWWWKRLGCGTYGYSTTDLPLRACYYIGKNEIDQSLVLASLSDEAHFHFWNGYLQTSRGGQFYGQLGSSVEEQLRAPKSMVEEVVCQLNELHFSEEKGEQVPLPEAAAFLNWMGFPYEGGWHSWNPHVQSWRIIPRIRQPIPGVNIYICGEAYSGMQGWVEGAINTTENLLQEHFGLRRASWIDEEYDLGP